MQCLGFARMFYHKPAHHCGGGGTSSGLNPGRVELQSFSKSKVDFTAFHATVLPGGRPGYCLADECTSALDLRMESFL